MLANILYALSYFVIIHTAKLPSNFGQCHKSDPNFNNCLIKNIEDAIRKLRNGAPELGLKPLEPLEIQQLTIGQGTGPVNVQQNFRNIKLHGLTGSIVTGNVANLEENILFSQSITPKLRLEGDYDMKGRVLLLPIFGDGKCNVTLYNTKINHTLIGEQYIQNNKIYMKIVKYHVTLYPDRVTFNFENLFNGDKRLGTEINNILNENWDAVFSDVRSGYEKSFGLIFQDLANRVFTRVAFNDIYLN